MDALARSVLSPNQAVHDLRSQPFSAMAELFPWRPALVVMVSYYVGNIIGFWFTPTHLAISTFWPPNAILLSALLLNNRKKWWALLLAAIPAHLLAQFGRAIPLPTIFAWYLGNAGEALLGAFLITRFAKPERLFGCIRGLLVFVTFGVIAAPLATSFLDAGAVVLTGFGRSYWSLLVSRQLSNMLAEISLVPLIVGLAVAGLSSLSRAPKWRYVEAVSLSTAAVVVSILVFTWEKATQTQIPILFYLLLPLFLWASVRFGATGVGLVVLCFITVASWSATHAVGTFTTVGGIMYLQVFLCLAAIPFLLLAAVLAQEREVAGFLKESRLNLIHTLEYERRRIARELHDDIGQSLALLQSSLSQLAEQSDTAMRLRLKDLGCEVGDIAKATRELSHSLHPSHLEHLGLIGALKQLCNDISRGETMSLQLEESSLSNKLDPEVALSLYRIAQEALTNARKYSGAEIVRVRFHVEPGLVRMTIEDDGVGLSETTQHPVGIGISCMRERMDAVGGTLNVWSEPGRGTTIEAIVPNMPPA